MPIEIVCDKRYEFEGPYRKSEGMYQDDILKDDSSWYQGISKLSINTH